MILPQVIVTISVMRSYIVFKSKGKADWG